MIITRKKEDGQYESFDVTGTFGKTDYVKDGNIYRSVPIKNVMVSSSEDLSDLSDYDIGTIAYTAGYQSIWQKGIDGTWESLT